MRSLVQMGLFSLQSPGCGVVWLPSIKAEGAGAFPDPSHCQCLHSELGSWKSSWVCQFRCDYRTAAVPVTIPPRWQKLITDNFTSESPNHTINEAGRHLWKLSSPSPTLKAGSARPAWLGSCLIGFWISPRVDAPQPVLSICATVWPHL